MTEQERQQIRREEGRKAFRAYLANRPGLSLSLDAIQRGLRNEGGYSHEECKDIAAYLISKGHIKVDPDSDGATPYYQITADGTLAYERS